MEFNCVLFVFQMVGAWAGGVMGNEWEQLQLVEFVGFTSEKGSSMLTEYSFVLVKL